MIPRSWYPPLLLIALALAAGLLWLRTSPTSPSSQGPGTLAGTPGAALATYLEGDFRGERLEGASWLTYRERVSWSTEPSWHAAWVVKRYEMAPAKMTGRTASIDVTYETLGELDLNTFVFRPSPTIHTVTYRLEAPSGVWKLTDPMLQPHPSVPAAKSFLKRMSVGHADRRVEIARAIQAMRVTAEKAPLR